MDEESKLTHVSPHAQIPAISHHLRTGKNGMVSTKTSSVLQPRNKREWNSIFAAKRGERCPNGREFMPNLRLSQLAQKILALTRPSASDFRTTNPGTGTAVGA